MFKARTTTKLDASFKIATLVVVVGLFLMVSPVTAFFWAVFLIWLAFQLDPRILGGVSVVFLILTAGASALHANARAEELAVYVFFMLVISVVLHILEYRRGGGVEEDEVAEKVGWGERADYENKVRSAHVRADTARGASVSRAPIAKPRRTVRAAPHQEMVADLRGTRPAPRGPQPVSAVSGGVPERVPEAKPAARQGRRPLVRDIIPPKLKPKSQR